MLNCLDAFHGPRNSIFRDKYWRRFAFPLARFAPLGRWIPFSLLKSTWQSGVGDAQVISSWTIHPSPFFLNELPILVWPTSIVSRLGVWMYAASYSSFWQCFALANRPLIDFLTRQLRLFTLPTEHTSTSERYDRLAVTPFSKTIQISNVSLMCEVWQCPYEEANPQSTQA